jgi:hypothetical protein
MGSMQRLVGPWYCDSNAVPNCDQTWWFQSRLRLVSCNLLRLFIDNGLVVMPFIDYEADATELIETYGGPVVS